ncbi:MAG: addiction module protein [Burkholderiales bacterium]
MNLTVDELVAQAEQLPQRERELLLERVRQTLPHAIDPGIEAAWIEEAERRLDAIERGEETTVPWEEVRKDLGLA